MRHLIFKKISIVLLFAITLSCSVLTQELAEDSFITPIEYGKNLYLNPRNIGCIKCHGEKGEGRIIATYAEKGKQKVIKAPQINNMDFDAFKKGINKDKGVMPKYNLTNGEIQAIYLYITSFMQ